MIEPVGKFTVATRAHHVDSIARTVELLRRYGEDVASFDRGEIQERLGSATYLARLPLALGKRPVRPGSSRLAAC